jgi:hypothetical protein
MPQLTKSAASQASASDAMTLNANDMDLDENYSSPTPTQLSNTLLQSEKAERQKEHDERLRNGNIVPRKQHKVGKKLDSLTHQLVIERVGVKATGASCPVYYCIGCDEDVKNIARDRSLPHAYSCMASALFTTRDLKILADFNIRLLLTTGRSYIEKLRMSYLRT